MGTTLQVLQDLSLQPHLRVPLGHLVAVLLDLITCTEKGRPVQVHALRVLCMAVDVLRASDLYADKLASSALANAPGRRCCGARATLRHFLPGISSALANALKQGVNASGQAFSASVLSGMLVAWAKAVAVAMEDEDGRTKGGGGGGPANRRDHRGGDREGGETTSPSAATSPLERLRMLAEEGRRLPATSTKNMDHNEQGERVKESMSQESLLAGDAIGESPAWWSVTCGKLSELVAGVLPTLVVHSSWVIRKTAVTFVTTLFKRCGLTLEGCCRIMLEVILRSLSDPFEEVRDSGRLGLTVLHALSHGQCVGGAHYQQLIMSGLDARFTGLLRDLGKNCKVEVRSADLLSSLRLAHGYAIFVGRIEEGSSLSKCREADERIRHNTTHTQH